MNEILLKLSENASPIEIILIIVLGSTFYILLKNQMNGLGKRLDGDIHELRQELKGEIGELKRESNDLKQEIKGINSRIDKLYDLILDLYKTLLKGDKAA